MNKIVCAECGSTNVRVEAWVDANTNKFVCEGGVGDGRGICDDCDSDEVRLTSIETGFKQLTKEEWDNRTIGSVAYIELDSGFHIALDITYMDQVDEFKLKLPTGEEIDTKYID